MKPSPTTPPSQGTLKRVPIADIVIPSGRKRSLHSVDELQQSIATVGLLNPIVLTEAKRLVAGLHRLHACQGLGWKAIPAMVLPLSAVDAELAEIDENLCRTELTVLEHAEHLARRKALYEARHPEAKHGAAKGKAGGGKVARAKEEIISSFADDTAERLGSTARNVRLDVQIAESLPEEVRNALRDTPVADRKVDLLTLAQMEDLEQRSKVVELLAAGETQTVAAALKRLASPATKSPAPLEPVYDKLGHLVTDPGIAEAFTVINTKTAEVLHHLRAAKRAWAHFHDEQVAAGRRSVYGSHRSSGYHSLRRILEEELGFMIFQVKWDSPYGLCPYCGGAPYVEDRTQQCRGCGGVGWGDRSLYRNAPPEMVAALDAKGVHEAGAPGGEAAEENEDAGISPPELTYGEVEMHKEAAAQARARQAAKDASGTRPRGG